MSNEIIKDWKNMIADIMETTNGFKNMESLIDDAMIRFKEMSNLFNMGGWNEFRENSLSNLYEMSRIACTFNPYALFMASAPPLKQDYKNTYDTYLKWMGLISIDDYQSLIKKYEEIKRQNHDLEKVNNEQSRRITELNQIATSEKKKSATQNKTSDETKAKLEEQKKIVSSLTKEIETQKKHSLSLEKEIDALKNLTDSLKKQLADKDQLAPKNKL